MDANTCSLFQREEQRNNADCQFALLASLRTLARSFERSAFGLQELT